MRKMFKYLLLLVVSVFFIYFIFRNQGEIKGIFDAVSDTKLRWLFIAILAQFFSYYFVVFAHKMGLNIVGIKRTEKELFPLVLSALVINTTAPTGGASGAFIFARDAKERHESPTAAATGVFVQITCYFIGLLSLLVFILTYLKFRGEIGLTEIISTFILFLITMFYIYLVVIAKQKPERLEKILGVLNKISFSVKKVFNRKTKFLPIWSKQVANELKDASKSIHDNPRKILETISINFITQVFNILTLFFIFLSFGIVTKFGILISGYAIGELLRIVSPAPEGVGVTEASMTLVFSSFGINPLNATAISLVYRGLNFWIPFFIGFIILQSKHIKPSDFKKDLNLD